MVKELDPVERINRLDFGLIKNLTLFTFYNKYTKQLLINLVFKC